MFDNAAAMMQIMGEFNKFKQNHPKFISFLKAVIQKGLPEGAIIEISVKYPGEDEKIESNMMIKDEDLKMIEALKNMSNK